MERECIYGIKVQVWDKSEVWDGVAVSAVLTGVVVAEVLPSAVLLAAGSEVHYHRRPFVGLQKTPNHLLPCPQPHRLYVHNCMSTEGERWR